MRWLRPLAVTALCASIAACTTSPTGRSQLLLLSDSELNEMGRQAFTQYQQDLPTAGQEASAMCSVLRMPLWQNCLPSSSS